MADEGFSDEEMAFFRQARFGALPGRARPDELGQAVETDPKRDWPELGPSREQWQAGIAGG